MWTRPIFVSLLPAGMLLCLVSPSASAARIASLPEETQNPAEAEIRRSLADWMDANNRGDREAASRIWAPGVEGWFPEAPEFRNDAAFRDPAAAAAARPTKSTFTLKIEEVMVSGNLAVVRDIWRETLHRRDGAVVARRTIRSFEVWRVQPDGRWRIERWISAPELWEHSS